MNASARPCGDGADHACCLRHPRSCGATRHHGARAAIRTQPLSSSRNIPPSSNSTYVCCPGDVVPATATFWRAPLPDSPPYTRFVQRLFAPFGRINRRDVLMSTAGKSTCAILRVSRGQVCKISMTKQRLEKTSHEPQEAGLFALVQDLLPLPDLEIAYCPGDGEPVVADAKAAAARWNGRTGCLSGVVRESAALLQFRCQSKAHLPFFFWYREETYGAFASWDATTHKLRQRSEAISWHRREPVAPLADEPCCLPAAQPADAISPGMPSPGQMPSPAIDDVPGQTTWCTYTCGRVHAGRLLPWLSQQRHGRTGVPERTALGLQPRTGMLVLCPCALLSSRSPVPGSSPHGGKAPADEQPTRCVLLHLSRAHGQVVDSAQLPTL